MDSDTGEVVALDRLSGGCVNKIMFPAYRCTRKSTSVFISQYLLPAEEMFLYVYLNISLPFCISVE